jgi:hypothetical protein
VSNTRPTIEELERILNDPNSPAVEITPNGEVVAKGLRYEVERALNKSCAENGCNTPDFILAEYLVSCLAAFDRAVNQRERWYGRMPIPGQINTAQLGQEPLSPNPGLNTAEQLSSGGPEVKSE